MLFNSYTYLFLFLPIVVIGSYAIKHLFGNRFLMAWLAISSFFFYGFWEPKFLYLILFSIIFNFCFGYLIAGSTNSKIGRMLLITSISTNLLLLGYYKFFNFLIENIKALGFNVYTVDIILPLAISFFTFQQIAYIIDCYHEKVAETSFIKYALFISFFPQLIAGPIVHHKETIPQFGNIKLNSNTFTNITIGFSILAVGLFKKVVIADQLAPYASFVFDAADSGKIISFFDAWTGTLCFTFQLYFDFSGYTDMAIGAAKMLGIKLPINFNSPYKAVNIIDFWRRWHITLSRFLRNYLYVPLGGNRDGEILRYRNIIITMLLGGLWHGAGWNFLIWGGMHGMFIIIVHLYDRMTNNTHSFSWWSIPLTFISVAIAWVYFRATSLSSANSLIIAMFGQTSLGNSPSVGVISLLIVSGIIVWTLPNLNDFFKNSSCTNIVQTNKSSITLSRFTSFLIGASFFVSLVFISDTNEFLYFNF